MANLPWVDLPTINPIGSGIDAFMKMAQHKEAQKQQAIDNLLKQKQMQAQEMQMRAQEARAQAEAARQASYAVREQHQYEHQQRQEAAGALPKMNEMIAAGDIGGAQALGNVHGINFKQVNGLEAPGAAPQAPQPGAAGPIPSPEDRNFAASQPGDMSQPDQSGAGMTAASDQAQAQDQQMASGREQYAAALAAHPQLVAEHAKRVQDYTQAKANPVYRGEGPFGPVEFNPGAVRAQKAQLQEQTAGQLAQGLPPQYQMRAMALIKSGVPAAEAARQIEIQQKAEEERNFKQSLAEQFQMTAGQKYQVGMAGAGSRERVASHADDRQGRTQYHADIAKDAGVIEKEYRTPFVESNKALKYLDADPNNPEAWIAGRDFFVKMASGGKVTKAQYDQAAGHSAPTTDRLNQILSGWTTGLPSEVQRKNLRAAIATMSKVVGGQLREKSAEFESNYGQDPLVAGGDKVATGTYQRTKNRLFADVPKEEVKPAGGTDRAALAREALADPTAPEAVKAQARKILGQ